MPKEVKIPEIKPITIKNWQAGIGDSQFVGFAEMRGMDIANRPGVLTLAPKLQNTATQMVAGTVTANVGTNLLTGPQMGVTAFGTTLPGIQAVTFSTTGTLPAPLATSTIYFITFTSGGGTSYNVATSIANAQSSTFITLTTTGTGVHTITPINPGYFIRFAQDTAGNNIFALDNNGRVWQLNTPYLWYLVPGNTLTGISTSNGLAVYKNYLFVFRNAAIDVYGILSGSPSWTNSWQTTLNGSTGGMHATCVGQDDILYFGDDDGNNNVFLGSISQLVNKVFNPADSTTYGFNTDALTLPKYKLITCIAELGVNLMIGTTGVEIYPWDRFSSTFNLPLICPEIYIYALQNAGNQLWIACGNRANMYLYNGYLVLPKKIFPKQLISNIQASATVGAICIVGRKLLFSVQTVGQSGIYSIDLTTNALSMENYVSGGFFGVLNVVKIPCLLSNGTYYFTSWQSVEGATNTGVDVSSNVGTPAFPDFTDLNNGIFGYGMSPNIDIGFFNQPRTLQYVEAYLDRPLASGHRVIVKYRTSQKDSFTTLATFLGDNINQVFQTQAANISGTDVQFMVVLVGDSSATPFLQELRVI